MYNKIVHLPLEWKNKLEHIANKRSEELGIFVSVSDLVRQAISKEYSLKTPLPTKRGRPLKEVVK